MRALSSIIVQQLSESFSGSFPYYEKETSERKMDCGMYHLYGGLFVNQFAANKHNHEKLFYEDVPCNDLLFITTYRTFHPKRITYGQQGLWRW